MFSQLVEFPPKSVLTDSVILNRYLRSRHPPVEAEVFEARRKQYEQEIVEQMKEDYGQMCRKNRIR